MQHLVRDREDLFRLFDEEQFIRRFRKATVLDIIILILLLLLGDILLFLRMYRFC